MPANVMKQLRNIFVTMVDYSRERDKRNEISFAGFSSITIDVNQKGTDPGPHSDPVANHVELVSLTSPVATPSGCVTGR